MAQVAARAPRPRLNRGLVLLGFLLIAAGLILKGYQVFADAGRPVNVLLMGVDEDKTRTDVVILAHWEPAHQLLSLVSIPRDTRVDIPCAGLKACQSPDKLAHAHAYGMERDQGPELTVAAVAKFLGVRIDHYVRVDFAGFEKVVNTLGGVTIDVEKPMYYEDPYARPKLVIDIKAGRQKLDGARALQYVRFRNDALGDIGRIDRTQRFFFALLASVRQSGVMARLPSLAGGLLPYVKTDLDSGTALALARAAQGLTPENLRTVSLPGQAQWENNLWFWIADEEKKQEIVREYVTHVQVAAANGR